jgi:hypothetical protein
MHIVLGLFESLTVLLAIERGDPRLPANVDGSTQRPRRWIRVTRLAGISAFVTFADFCDYICSDIETNTVEFQILTIIVYSCGTICPLTIPQLWPRLLNEDPVQHRSPSCI